MKGKTGQRISQQQLESYLWGAATLLRGTIDAGDYKQFIFPLLFYKRLCDVFDEERDAAVAELGKDFPENHRFQIPRDAHWNKVREVTTNVGTALQSAMRSIEKANQDKLYGIFGDAQWTNKDRLSDAMLRNLIEHFSGLDLTIGNLPEDELGNGYEYLIKKFADDSGHTAAEFYTNRTVVHLMTELLQPQPGESIYDPTCGSGGMLLSAIAHLKTQGKEWRNVMLYGQELNLMTSSIARMNCFLHGVDDFRIERGDTLANPKFIEGGEIQRFDVILANPPYSIKQWDRESFETDPWGRNLYGTPPQGCADYAFQQHINKSLAVKSGRCAILWPHGILFRQAEAEIRNRMISDDLIECVIGLGKNLFYNSAMEACILICRANKSRGRRGKILLIDAATLVARERGQSFLTPEHIARIAKTYADFTDVPGFARVIGIDETQSHGGSLAIPLYVNATKAQPSEAQALYELGTVISRWSEATSELSAAFRDIAPGVAFPEKELGEVAVPSWLNRAEWKRVSLKEVAVRTAKKVELDAGQTLRWVGADHVDEARIHVTRWSDTNDPLLPPTFCYEFQAGTVLLHSRNPKKVAMPDFGGITGEKFFVLKSRDEGVLQTDYLAWVMLSRAFQDWVGTQLSGSVNKFLNWSKLARFEFDLPPSAQQQRIATLLWEPEKLAAAIASLQERLSAMRKAILRDHFDNLPPETPLRRIDEIGEVKLGRQRAPQFTRGISPKPYLRVVNVVDGELDLRDVEQMDFDDRDFEMYRLRAGDVLVTEGDLKDPMNVGRAAIYRDEIPDCCFQKTLIRFRPGGQMTSEYALAAFQHARHQRTFARVASTTTVTHLTAVRFAAVKIRVPEPRLQSQLVEKLFRVDQAALAARRIAGSVNAIQTGLRAAFAGGAP